MLHGDPDLDRELSQEIRPRSRRRAVLLLLVGIGIFMLVGMLITNS